MSPKNKNREKIERTLSSRYEFVQDEYDLLIVDTKVLERIKDESSVSLPVLLVVSRDDLNIVKIKNISM